MPIRVVVLFAGLVFSTSAPAGLFDDNEARKAILELRQRVEANRVAADQAQQKQAQLATQLSAQLEELSRRINDDGKRALDDGQAAKRGALELTNQLEALRAEQSRQRGTIEQLARDVAEVQRRQKDALQALEDRLRRFEPQRVTVDGREFFAEPGEKREFEAALSSFRRGEFGPSTQAFGDFVRRNPGSGYASSALFWLGNAQYAIKEFKDSVASFRDMLKRTPDHPRAAEAMLAVGNALIELKDVRGARAALQELLTAFPQSEAAATAKDRLSKLR